VAASCFYDYSSNPKHYAGPRELQKQLRGDERVSIIGGGFAGIAAAHALKRADVEITLIDRIKKATFVRVVAVVRRADRTHRDFKEEPSVATVEVLGTLRAAPLNQSLGGATIAAPRATRVQWKIDR
jgi:ribosomal protein L20A (L18A)